MFLRSRKNVNVLKMIITTITFLDHRAEKLKLEAASTLGFALSETN